MGLPRGRDFKPDRLLGVDPAATLDAANARFAARFAVVESAEETFPPPGDPARLAAMEACWQRAKDEVKRR